MIGTDSVITSRPQRLLREGMLSNATAHPDKVAVVIKGKSYTYAELADASLCLAASLQENGAQKGDRIAIYMDNTWPCIVSIYGALLAGCVFLVINPQTRREKLHFVLDDSGSAILLTDGHLADVFIPAIKNLGDLVCIISSGTLPQQDAEQSIPIYDFYKTIENTKPLSMPVKVIPNDLAALIYTSGSTGDPKGVMQTHQSMVFAAWSLIEYLRLSEKDRIMLVLPLTFDYGLYQLLMTMKSGATLILEQSFTYPAVIYKRIDTEKVTVFPGLPTIFSMMISTHKKNKLCFQHVEKITNTAAALPVAFIPYLQEIFPNALIYKMYGLTECKRVSYLEPELIEEKPTSVGIAIPGTEIYLLSPQGEPVPYGKKGVLYVRGPHIMLGYWNQPELSAKMLKPGKLYGETVLCTHDLFTMDEEGFLYFVGRSDDIIKSRGEKVSPKEIENVLFGIPELKEVAVVGKFDDIFGESILAYIVKEDGANIDERAIKRYCLLHLENFMVPHSIIFMNEMPKMPNGKIDKKRLRQRI